MDPQSDDASCIKAMKSIQQLKAIVGKNKEGGDKKGHSNRILLASIIVYTTAFPYKLLHVNDVHSQSPVIRNLPIPICHLYVNYVSRL